MHLAPLINDLALILVVAGVVSLFFQKLRQPVVLGYIIAGMGVGAISRAYGVITDAPSIQIWGQIGVIFLMFSLGLEFSFRKLAKVGPSAAITACFEVAFMFGVGYWTGRAFGWTGTNCVFLGAMMSMSSTTIAVKSLSELNLKTRRFAEMIFAVLIVEDLLAILMLVGLTALVTQASLSGLVLLGAALKLVLVIGTWFVTGYFVVPRFIRYVGRLGGNEILTVLSLGFCLGLSALAARMDYSVALGAFIMGSILAESTESYRIEELLTPLRDLFSAVFFVSVGMLIDPATVWAHIGQVLVLTGVVIVGNSVAVTLGALLTGQTLRTAVQVGFGMAQIGEFSFIIAGLGAVLKVTGDDLYPVAVAVSLLTAFTTPLMIRRSHRVATSLEKKLPLGLREALSRYVIWTQARRADTARKKVFYRLALKWLLNGIVVSAVFVLCAELAVPKLGEWLGLQMALDPDLLEGLGWALSALISAPFILAMFSTFRHFHFYGADAAVDHPPRGGTLLLFRLLTVIWIGTLGLEFFQLRIVVVIVIALIGLLLGVFHRQLENSYAWFERRFLSAFEGGAKSRPRRDLMRSLAPWDAHLVRIKVHPNSEMVAKKLAETQLKSRHGVSVVAIQRGTKAIVAPKPMELILPKDELLVLGTDEQIERIRKEIERPPGLENRYQDLSAYELQPVRVASNSTLVGRSIRESRIREDYHAMVVGIERGGNRIINPPSDTVLGGEDILWVVGEIAELSRLNADFSLSQGMTDAKPLGHGNSDG